MKYPVAVRYFVVFLLTAGMFLTAPAQSGRKGKPKPNTQNQQAAEAEKEKEEDKKAAERPLADNTPTAVSDDGTIKLETAIVTIPVSVTDREGRLLSDLKKREFRIYEDGVEQQIESFQSIEVPFHVVLLLDTSMSARFKLSDIQAAALAFVNQLRAEDKVIVVSFDSSVYLMCDFTSDREQLRQAIYRTKTGGSTKLFEAVDLSISEALKPIRGRKAVVLFTDGVDTASRRSTATSTLNLVEESDALVFPIRYDTEFDDPQAGVNTPRTGPFPLPGGGGGGGKRPRFPFPFAGQFVNFQFPGQWPQGKVPTPAGDYRRAEVYLKDLADRSGGKLFFANSLQNLSDSFSMIAEELRHQYAVSYYPSNSVRDGSYRRIKVKVSREEAIVRARDGYRATPAGAQAEAKENRKRPEFKRKQSAKGN